MSKLESTHEELVSAVKKFSSTIQNLGGVWIDPGTHQKKERNARTDPTWSILLCNYAIIAKFSLDFGLSTRYVHPREQLWRVRLWGWEYTLRLRCCYFNYSLGGFKYHRKRCFLKYLSVIKFRGRLWDLIILAFIITTLLPKPPPFWSFNFFDNDTPTLLKICYVTTCYGILRRIYFQWSYMMVSGHSWELPAWRFIILTAIEDIHCPKD